MARRLFALALLAAVGLSVSPVAMPMARAQGFLERLLAPRTYQPPQQNNNYNRFDPYGRPRPGYSPYGYNPPPGYGPPAYLPPQGDQQRAPRSSEPPLPKVNTVAKDPEAAPVLVVGDFLASSVADGLTFSYGDEAKLTVVDRTNAASGLVRDDSYDWNKQLPDILNKVKPAYVVFMIGTNDRQPLRTGPTQRDTVRSEAWEAAYRKRIDGILATLKAYNKPYFWVGLPPMASAASSADMAYFNGIFKARIDATGGGKFIDVWNGFADETGNFTLKSPDADGQVRTMRFGDGINFTRAGSIKLAYYVDRELRKKDGGPIETLATSATMEEKIEIGPRGERWLVGPVISLTDPPPGSAGRLVGAAETTNPAEGSVQYKVVVEGAALPHVAGRADDVSWPPVKGEFSPAMASLPAPAARTATTTAAPARGGTSTASSGNAATAPKPATTATAPAAARTTIAPANRPPVNRPPVNAAPANRPPATANRTGQQVAPPQYAPPGRSTFFGTQYGPGNAPIPPGMIGGR